MLCTPVALLEAMRDVSERGTKPHPNKLLYIGANTHLTPVRHFPNTKEFIFIDTQPRSEFDREHIFETCFYRHRFYKRLLRTLSQYGFILLSTTVLDKQYEKTLFDDNYVKKHYEHCNPTLLYFSNPVTSQTLKYYISTNILYNMCPVLEQDIKQTDGLIISGYHPHQKVLDYLPKSVRWYCYNSTCYSYDEYNPDTIIGTLHRDNMIGTFIVMDYHSGKQLCACDTIQEVSYIA